MITSISQTSLDGVTTLTAVSNLTGTVYYFWYYNGGYVTTTTQPSMSFQISPGEQATVDVLDSNSSTFDPLANAPAAFPPTRTLVFYRSLDAAIASYQIQQSENSEGWTTIGYVTDVDTQWSYAFQTDRLDDLSTYAWQVIPLDAAGNAGTAVAIAAEEIVRQPDAPDFTVSFGPLGSGWSDGFSDGFGSFGSGVTFALA